jgi:hypothetical protein
MPGLIPIIGIIFTMLAGVGFLELADKFLPDKVSGYEAVSPGIKPGKKIAIFLLCMTAGAIAWRFIKGRFHVLARRHPRRKRSKK